jgi:hypothetical protein
MVGTRVGETTTINDNPVKFNNFVYRNTIRNRTNRLGTIKQIMNTVPISRSQIVQKDEYDNELTKIRFTRKIIANKPDLEMTIDFMNDFNTAVYDMTEDENKTYIYALPLIGEVEGLFNKDSIINRSKLIIKQQFNYTDAQYNALNLAQIKDRLLELWNRFKILPVYMEQFNDYSCNMVVNVTETQLDKYNDYYLIYTNRLDTYMKYYL